MNPLYLLVTVAVMVVVEKVVGMGVKDPTSDLDSPEREAAKHKGDTGNVAGDKVNGVLTGGDLGGYTYLFTSATGDKVYSREGRTNQAVYVVSTIPGIDPVLWGVPPPAALVANNTLLPSDIVRFTPAPQAVYSRTGSPKGSINASGVFSTTRINETPRT